MIHHSAGDFGTIEFLQQVHRERQPNDPIDAIPYHYVIGNGNGLGLGEVAQDWRGERGIWGAHLSGNNTYTNVRGIGICLIGNFQASTVPPAQLAALISLTKDLMSRHGIRTEDVLGHGRVDGESTLCPGENFPWSEFQAAIAT